jgi:thiamine-phosphate pyrophosphorylase
VIHHQEDPRHDPPVVVLVTDANVDLGHTVEIVRAAATALGPRRLLVQLRDKENGPVVVRKAAQVLREATHAVDALFVVNGVTSIARDVGADGVHFPRDRSGALASQVASARRLLGERIIVTAAVHDDEEVRAAVEGGVTGVLVSPIFVTPGKGSPRGTSALRSAKDIVVAARSVWKPRVYALGGVNVANVNSCAEAGADGVAVIRALYHAGASGGAATALALAAPFGAGPPPRG